MKVKMKRIMGLFLALAVFMGCVSLNPIASYANDANEETFNINERSVNITKSGTYTIYGTGHATSNTISVPGSGITAKITLKNVNIDVSNQTQKAAFFAKNYDQSNVHLTIILTGTNSLKSDARCAGLTWNNSDNSTLEIKGDGSLTAIGGYSAAGIGGSTNCSGKNIKITGGSVTAIGGGNAAGIGGGYRGSGDNITITGGTVTATGDGGAAGIGDGRDLSNKGTNITITGGSVKANSISTTPNDGNGHDVYLVKLENQGSVNKVTVDSGTGNAKTFTRAGSHPDVDTAFYLYLTGKDHDLVTSKGNYNAEWNSNANRFAIIEFDSTNVKSMSVTAQPTRLTYTEGDKLDLTGLVVTLTDDHGKTKEVKPDKFTDNGITATPENGTPLTVANHNDKTVKLTKDGVSAVETHKLQVKVRVFDSTHVKSMSVTHQPSKMSYTADDKLDLSGLVVTLKDDHNLTKDVTPAEFGTYGINANPENGTPLTVANHNDKTVKLTKDGVPAVETDALTVKAISASADAEDLSAAEAAHATVAMYRLYNTWTHEHLFTTDKAEYDSLVAAGWTGEGEIDAVAAKQGKGVYRLYNPYTHEHHYTAKEDEVASCVAAGWVNEGIKFHSVQNGTVPVYSMYNPYEKKFYHHYTSDPDEIAKMVKDGWIKEEIKWYATK